MNAVAECGRDRILFIIMRAPCLHDTISLCTQAWEYSNMGMAISERCALHTPAGFYLKHGGHATQNSAPTASACPHALPSLYRLLGGAPTLVPAREGAPGNVPALGATMRRNLVPTRWLLCHSLHCRLHSFLCSHFHCSRLNRLSRTHPNHGSNKNHPNTYPTHRCGDHRNSSNIHTYIYI